MNHPPSPRYFAVVPAAGVGKRMRSLTPKQYLTVAGKPVIQHTLERLLAVDRIESVLVALSPQDEYWMELGLSGHGRIRTATGGQERADSVLSALNQLGQTAHRHDWVLVHDAARPCVAVSDINKLIDTLASDPSRPVGGILAVPVSDTLKEVVAGNIKTTLDRSLIWRAQTPQMFRLEALRSALMTARAQGQIVTDEASALELLGFQPRIVEGRPDNIKITCPEDISLAAFYLEKS